MPLRTDRGEIDGAMFVSAERLCLDASGTRVVPADSTEAASLLVCEGGRLPLDQAQRLGLVVDVPDPEVAQLRANEEAAVERLDTYEELLELADANLEAAVETIEELQARVAELESPQSEAAKEQESQEQKPVETAEVSAIADKTDAQGARKKPTAAPENKALKPAENK